MKKEYIIAGAAGIIVIGGIIFGIVKFTGKSGEQVVTNGDIQVVMAEDGTIEEPEDPNAGELDIMLSDDYEGDIDFLNNGGSADNSQTTSGPNATGNTGSDKTNAAGQSTPVTVIPVAPAANNANATATTPTTGTSSNSGNGGTSSDTIIEEPVGGGSSSEAPSSYDASEGMVYETERIPVL